ncbi:MAG: glycosyltransferase family 4 protein [Rhodothermales bacterium]
MTPRRRVLLITYYWPPSGGSGVQRTLKFVKYLREFDWEPVVLTVHPDHAAWPDRDEELLADVPAGVKVIQTRSWDPYAAYAHLKGATKANAVGVGFLGDAERPDRRERFARWVRANVFLPDARVGWVPFARRESARLLASEPVDAVFTSGPPQSAHLVGAWLQKRTGTPWVADLRDAWPDVAYGHLMPTGSLAARFDRAVRQRTLERASALVTVSDEVARYMEQETGLPFRTLSNGFDPDDIEQAEPKSLPGFTVVHVGNLSPARNPAPLWDVLTERPWPDVRVVLVGNVDGSIRRHVASGPLADVVTEHPYVPHSEALGHMKGASLLLLPINRVTDGAGIVTGKIYEYVASGRPVLAFGVPGGEADRILRESGAGRVFAYDDRDGIRSELERHVTAWREGKPLVGAASDAARPWSRREQTGRLAGILNEIAGKSRPN